MRINPIIVQKYGGACLETPAKIRAVASSLADLHSRGHRVVAIVSAMGKTTDELVKIAYQVSPHPNRRELDMLLTTGERISMSLMSMALSDLGVPAISFTGSQAGVLTDESHSSARILDVRPIRVREELDRGRIVVLVAPRSWSPRTSSSGRRKCRWIDAIRLQAQHVVPRLLVRSRVYLVIVMGRDCRLVRVNRRGGLHACFQTLVSSPSCSTSLSRARISSVIRCSTVLCSSARATRSKVPHPTRMSGPDEPGWAAA
jgi:hypothetical protein